MLLNRSLEQSRIEFLTHLNKLRTGLKRRGRMQCGNGMCLRQGNRVWIKLALLNRCQWQCRKEKNVMAHSVLDTRIQGEWKEWEDVTLREHVLGNVPSLTWITYLVSWWKQNEKWDIYPCDNWIYKMYKICYAIENVTNNGDSCVIKLNFRQLIGCWPTGSPDVVKVKDHSCSESIFDCCQLLMVR